MVARLNLEGVRHGPVRFQLLEQPMADAPGPVYQVLHEGTDVGEIRPEPKGSWFIIRFRAGVLGTVVAAVLAALAAQGCVTSATGSTYRARMAYLPPGSIEAIPVGGVPWTRREEETAPAWQAESDLVIAALQAGLQRDRAASVATVQWPEEVVLATPAPSVSRNASAAMQSLPATPDLAALQRFVGRVLEAEPGLGPAEGDLLPVLFPTAGRDLGRDGMIREWYALAMERAVAGNPPLVMQPPGDDRPIARVITHYLQAYAFFARARRDDAPPDTWRAVARAFELDASERELVRQAGRAGGGLERSFAFANQVARIAAIYPSAISREDATRLVELGDMLLRDGVLSLDQRRLVEARARHWRNDATGSPTPGWDSADVEARRAIILADLVRAVHHVPSAGSVQSLVSSARAAYFP